MLKILIADDHPVVRRGLKQIIADAPDMVVADEARTGWEVINKVRESDYDVVLLDIAMPGKNGIDLLSELKRSHSDVPVLMISAYADAATEERALELGALELMRKPIRRKELLDRAAKVVGG